MDPITIGIGIGALITTLGAGVLVGKRLERRSDGRSELDAQINQLTQENRRLKDKLEYAQDREDRLQGYYETAQRERDEYRRMAETHEVKIPEVPQEEVIQKVLWEDRRFCGHPQANLDNLKVELDKYKDQEIVMAVRIQGSGPFSAWGEHIKDKWHRVRNGRKESITDLGPWEYHGTATRALEDFETQIRDDDSGFMYKTKNSNGKVWRDRDSPLLFEVSVTVLEKHQPKVPEVQIVEVPVVEVRHEVIEVEKPVFISVPEGQEAGLCGHTQEEIRRMVKDELQRFDAETEVEALGHLAGIDVEAAKDHIERAKRAKASRQGQ